jgi:hypothetical protein
MTKDSILGLLLVVLLVGELMTNFGSSTLHFLMGMTILTAINFGE